MADVERIGELWEQLVIYHHALDARLPAPALNGGHLYARRVADKLDDSHTRVFVAQHDGRVIGFALGVIVDLVPEMFASDRGGFLADIYVEDDFRRQGIGRRLVDALAAWFRSRGVNHLELYVAARNHEGRSFWASLGGTEVMQRVRVELTENND